MSGKASTYYPNNIRPKLGDTISGTNLQKIVKELQNRVTILEAENVLLFLLLAKYGNPELADSEMNQASVETLYETSQVDEEKVHPWRKL